MNCVRLEVYVLPEGRASAEAIHTYTPLRLYDTAPGWDWRREIALDFNPGSMVTWLVRR